MFLQFDELPAIEASRNLGFSGKTIDPQAEKRSEDAGAQALAHEHAEFLLFCRNKIILSREPNLPCQALFTREIAMQFSADMDNAIFLGEQDGHPHLSVQCDVDPDTLPSPYFAAEYRALYTENLLSSALSGEIAQAAALGTWHRNHRFCGRCGHLTHMRIGGYKRVCSHCQAEHFPRTDPVVIMLIASGDKCLLARGAHFAPLTYSCLAGFIEPGETIEAAVRRETHEEMGIKIGRVGYFASQPWPFPYSLMIGCHAQALHEDYKMDETELEDGRWFTRSEVLTMLDGSHPQQLRTPPSGAIAHALIHAWAHS